MQRLYVCESGLAFVYGMGHIIRVLLVSPILLEIFITPGFLLLQKEPLNSFYNIKK